MLIKETNDTNDNYNDNFVVDDYDFDIGLKKVEQSINNKSNNNPFFVDINKPIKIEKKDIYHNHKNVIVLYFNSNIDKKQQLTDIQILSKPELNIDELTSIKSILYTRCSSNILQNKYHLDRISVVKQKYLNAIYPNDTFDLNEIVVQLFEIPDNNIHIYLNLYQNNISFETLKVNLDFSNHYLQGYRYPIHKNMNMIIESIDGSTYWSNEHNCNINMSQSFTTRGFRLNTDTKFTSIVTKTINNIINQDDSDKSDKSDKLEKSIYDDQPTKHKFKNNTFIDPAQSILNQHVKRTFYSTLDHTDKCKIKKEEINTIFSLLKTEEEKYLLMNNLLASKEYCHLLINNIHLLKDLKPIFDKFKHVFKYTIGYAWITMYFEECLTKTFSKKDSRFVFDINTAHELPVFPYNYNQIKQNPYATLLIDDKEIGTENCFGIKFIKDKDLYGVCSLDTFKTRLNMFMTHDKNKDIFAGLDWDKFALSGSLIPACLLKKSPLLYHYEKMLNNEDLGFIEYINTYYKSSDIDMMCNDVNIFDFMKNVKGVYDIIVNNCNLQSNDIKIDTIKNVGIALTKYFAKECLDDINKTFNTTFTTEDLQNNLIDPRVKYYLYNLYIKTKTSINADLLKNNKLDFTTSITNDYLNPVSIDELNIYIRSDEFDDNKNDDITENKMIFKTNYFRSQDNQVEESKNKILIKITETYRYKIIPLNFNKYFKRPIEIFKTYKEDFFSTVARFHYPCVRAYYQNNNVYILPSCITSMMTGLNIEYKYFSSIRDPIEIINKYITRGFGLIMNKEEINKMKEFNKNVDKFKDCKDILKGKTINTSIFNLNNHIDTNTYVNTEEDLIEYYNSKLYPVNICRFTAIKENGCIRPYNKSYVKMMYDIDKFM